MDFNEEDSILPILNQVKAFQSKWLAKNKQCETLESFLNSADAKNRELEAKNNELKSSLNAAVAKNKEIKSINADLKSSLREKNSETEELQSKFETLKSSLEAAEAEYEKLRTIHGTTESSLITANVRVKELNVKCKSLKSSLDAAHAKYEQLQKNHETTESSLISANLRIKELDSKCTALESLLHKADYENKNLKTEIDKLKTANIEEKRKAARITLEKIQNKLLVSPLHAMINRVKHNIETLDEIARNSVSVPLDTGIEIVDILSSDSDEESTLSLTSEKQNIDDVLESSPSQVIDKTEPSERSNLEPALPCTTRSCLEDTNENPNRGNQIEVDDDLNYDSDISLSICDDVTSTTAEEENLDESSGKLSTLILTSSRESSSSTCSSIIINSQTSPAKQPETETPVQKSDPVISQASHDVRSIEEKNKPSNVVSNEDPNANQVPTSEEDPEIVSVTVGEITITDSSPSTSSNSHNETLSNENQNKSISNHESQTSDSKNETLPYENQNTSTSNHVKLDDQVQAIVSKLLKSGNYLKVMDRVVLTPVQEENCERAGVNAGVSIESNHSSLPSIAESTREDSSSMKHSPDRKRHVASKLKCCS